MKDVKNAEITITDRTTIKKDMWYVVLNLPKDKDGKRKPKWISTGLRAIKNGRKINVREAEQRLLELRLEYSKMEHIATPNLTSSERKKLSQANDYLDVYAMDWLQKRIDIEVTTYDAYKQLINCHIKGYFTLLRNLKFKDITDDDIAKFYKYLLDEKKLKGSTAIKYHNLLHSIFKDAYKKHIIKENPFVEAEIRKPRFEKYNGTFYNVDEINEMLNYLGDDPIRIVVIIAACYGLRRSEVLGIKWDAIDFDNDTISIQHKVVVNKEVKKSLHCTNNLKNNSSYRTYGLIPEVKEELLKHKQRQKEMKELWGKSYSTKYEDYVCVNKLGDLIKPDYVTEHFARFIKNNKLKKIRFHDLRHSCASNLLSSGKVSLAEIQDWLGHSDISTTANIYAHRNKENKNRTMLVIQNAYSLNSSEASED